MTALCSFLKNWFLLLLSAVVVLVLWFNTPKIVTSWSGYKPVADTVTQISPYATTGPFGDTFGVTTSLFSALTALLVVAGLIFQREEISELKDEKAKSSIRARLQAWPWIALERQQQQRTEEENPKRTVWIIPFHMKVRGGLALDVTVDFPSDLKKDLSFVVQKDGIDVGPEDLFKFVITSKILDPLVAWKMRINFYTLAGDKGFCIFTVKGDKIDRETIFPWEAKTVKP